MPVIPSRYAIHSGGFKTYFLTCFRIASCSHEILVGLCAMLLHVDEDAFDCRTHLVVGSEAFQNDKSRAFGTKVRSHF